MRCAARRRRGARAQWPGAPRRRSAHWRFIGDDGVVCYAIALQAHSTSWDEFFQPFSAANPALSDLRQRREVLDVAWSTTRVVHGTRSIETLTSAEARSRALRSRVRSEEHTSELQSLA